MAHLTATFQCTVGPSWPGFEQIKYLVIFGDSYSAIGYHPRTPYPTEEEPLGAKFPGNTYTESRFSTSSDGSNKWVGTPNWVGHLIVSEKERGHKMLAYDYAVGGHTVAGVRNQIEHWFLPIVGRRPEEAPWREDNTLFITWIGINDCAFSGDNEENMNRLFESEEELYKAGARNFMFIDVPPIHQSPAIGKRRENNPNIIKKYTGWNTLLRARAHQFSESHPDATVLLFSSWRTFDNVNTDPEKYGFRMEDRKKMSGAIWVDHLHPTSAMQKIVAEDIMDFLSGFPAVERAGADPTSLTG